MSDWKQIKDLKIGADIYDELYNKILEDDEEQDEYDFDDFDEFLLYNGNSEGSLCLLSEGNKYYIDGVMNEWDDIIKILDDCNMLEDMKPKDMTKRKITDLFLYQVCVDVIGDYVEELNSEKKEEKEKEEKRVNKYNDFKEEVDENNYRIGMIDGKSLKKMAIGEYFNKFDVDEEECYEIMFYEAKEENKDLPKAFSDCYFKIEDLCEKIHYVSFNTSSVFAVELGNICFNDEEDA